MRADCSRLLGTVGAYSRALAFMSGNCDLGGAKERIPSGVFLCRKLMYKVTT